LAPSKNDRYATDEPRQRQHHAAAPVFAWALLIAVAPPRIVFAVTVLVGLSRVALGVHYATDVLGGWAFSSAWVMVWLLLGRYLAKR